MKQRILKWKLGQSTLHSYLENLSLTGTVHSVIATKQLETSAPHSSGREITLLEAVIIVFPFE